jgi:hypothetical protein
MKYELSNLNSGSADGAEILILVKWEVDYWKSDFITNWVNIAKYPFLKWQWIVSLLRGHLFHLLLTLFLGDLTISNTASVRIISKNLELSTRGAKS